MGWACGVPPGEGSPGGGATVFGGSGCMLPTGTGAIGVLGKAAPGIMPGIMVPMDWGGIIPGDMTPHDGVGQEGIRVLMVGQPSDMNEATGDAHGGWAYC